MRFVAIPSKLLNEGERVVVSTRTHVKVLVGALLVLLVTVFVTGFLAAVVQKKVDDDLARTVCWVALALAVAFVVIRYVLVPFVRWYTTTYTFTDRRFMQRSGLIAKEGRTIPLNRISGVDFEIGLVDRMFGCGTLVVSDASEQGRVPLKDIPHVEEVQRLVAEELHQLTHSEGRDRSSDDGT
jgi:uncharacterized membrane protein YdbT with pleckstrin-like domain